MARQHNQRTANTATDAATDAEKSDGGRSLHIRYLQEIYVHTMGSDQSPLTEYTFSPKELSAIARPEDPQPRSLVNLHTPSA